MSESCGRMDPLEAVFGKGKALEKRRCKPEGVNSGTDIVNEAGQGQFRRPRSATDGVPRFNDTNGMACPGNFDRRRKTVRARPDHHRIEFHRVIVYALKQFEVA